jgi:hypothetical protein
MAAGLYGTQEGMLSKMHTSISPLASTVSTPSMGGCAIWFPDYTGQEEDIGEVVTANFFISHSSLSSNSTTPRNTTVDPFGGTTSGMQAYRDPTYSFVVSDVVKDFRTIGACMSLGYTGKLADCQGEVVTTRLPLTELLDPSKEGQFSPQFTINRLFQYSANAQRFTPAGVECIWTPDEESHTFADERPGPFAVVEVGMPGIAPSKTSATMMERNPMAIVIAWRGFDGAMPLSFKLSKAIEWRPKVVSGLTHVAPVTLAPASITAKLATAARESGLADRLGDALTGGLSTAATHLATAVYNGFTNSSGPLHALTAIGR